MFSPDETLDPLETPTNKMCSSLCNHVSVQDYSELIITHSLHTMYIHSKLLPDFRIAGIQD